MNFKAFQTINRDFLAKIGVGASHAGEHLDKVVELCQEASKELSCYQRLVIKYAAELHETDDKKYGGDLTFKNAIEIMKQNEDLDDDFIKDVVFVISLVSCSTNKDFIPENAEPWHLIVRHADRLEGVDIKRGIEYGLETGQPLFLDTTERATSVEDLYARLATKERYANYKKSVSFIDHFYDKLLHILAGIDNLYLKSLAGDKQEKMEQLCLKFGETGTITREEIAEFY